MSKNSVRWYAEYEGARVELETEQLLNPRHLERVFMDKLTKLIPLGKRNKWEERLKELMQTCERIEDAEDASEQGQFENLLDNFFSGETTGEESG